MSGRLANRVAIITGAGRGIGRATALLFAAEGAKVVVATRTPEPGAEVAAAIREAGGEAYLHALDMGDRESVRALVARAAETWGRLDIVLHNAAHIPFGAIGALPDAELDKVFDVGLKACFWLAGDALPHLRQSPCARILITSSLAGNSRNFVNLVHYGALKAGVNGFIKGAALELARQGINVAGIEPGQILGHAMRQSASDEALAAMASVIPIPRQGLPEEIAAGFLYLASDDARYITGQTIAIDGGLSVGRLDNLKFDRLKSEDLA
jgi:3-oxoacyl-[acyl-carrier protein] reductase